MIELVIVSRLLEYPDAALWQHQQELFDAMARRKLRRRMPIS
jgi:nitrate reductase delta subunit